MNDVFCNQRGQHFLIWLGLWWLVILLVGFGAALMGSSAGDIARALAPVVASIIGGGFVLTAALIAWKSVQAKINAEQHADQEKFQLAITAELLVFSSTVMKAASDWNQRAHQTPAAGIPQRSGWPKLNHPHLYLALVSHIGLIEGWAASAVISFYGNVLDLNEMSTEAMQDRPTIGENIGTIARRFQTMAMYLADALDGLNANRVFPIVGHDPSTLIAPNGAPVTSTAT